MKQLYTIYLCVLMVVASAFTAKAQDDLKVIFDIDFSEYYNGVDVAVGTDLIGSYKSSSLLYKATGWYGSKVTAGDGYVLVADQGSLESPSLGSMIYSSTPIKVTAVIKAASDKGAAQFYVGSSYSPNYMGLAVLYDEEWTTVQMVYGPTTTLSSISIFKMAPFLAAEGICVRSLKMETSSSFVAPPKTVYQPGDADGTKFTARWTAVSGATGYELDVYSYDNDGKKVYFLEKQQTTTTSYTVTGLDPEVTYFFVVRAMKGENVSMDSDEIEVVKVIDSIDIPANPSVASVTTEGFTVQWEPVANADYYVVKLHEHEKMEHAGNATVFAENFDGIITSGTFASPSYDGYLDDYVKEKGWLELFSSKAFAPGAYVLAPYSGMGYVATPAIDLSSDNGNAQVTLNLAQVNYGTYLSGGKVVVDAIEGDDIVTTNVLSSAEITIDEKAYKNYTVNLMNCTANTRIRIGFSPDDKRLYIDELTVSQEVPAGTVIVNQVQTVETPKTSHYFEYPASEAKTVSFTVHSVGRTVSSNDIVPINSDPTDHVFVDFTEAGVGNVAVDNAARAWKAGQGVVAVDGKSVKVYATSGALLYAADGLEGTTFVNLSAKGVVIVVVDGNVVKLAL